jgi:hypothetical protein
LILTSLHNEYVLSITLLRLEEVLGFEFNLMRQALGSYETLSSFTSLGKVLNDELFDLRVSSKKN